MNNMVSCDLCKASFALTRDALTEQQVILEREGFPDHPVQLTSLTCPHCGKSYPVVMDDETTLPFLEEARALYVRKIKYEQKRQPIQAKLQEKCKKNQQKLGFYRRRLAEKFNGSFYQTADGKQQLDYRYHER